MGAVSNSFKTILLLGLLTALLLWVGQLLGGTTGLLFALFFVLLFNLVSYWFSDRIVLAMYRAKEIESGHVVQMVQAVAQQAGLPMPRVYLIRSATPNAFATGRSPKKAAVAVTQGILDLLSDRELKGVLAHEMSHVKNRDTLIQTVAAIIAGVIGFVASMARWGAIFGGFGGNNNDGGDLISLLVLAIVTPLMAMIIQLALSRTREYAADASAAKILNDSSGLRHALQKLDRGNKVRPMRGANPSTAPLFIINPLKGGGLLELLSTHPATEKRIKALERLPY